MTFNSWEFLIFFPVVVALYFLLPKKCKWPMLLIASYFFYMYYQAELVVLILGTTLISWLASNVISRSKKGWVRKLMLTLTLVVCFGVLFFFKYFNFLADSVVSIVELLGGEPDPVALDLILPVGISFYTFQTLSYVIDVYRGDIEPERNFFFYALFVSFFPQLVAGPIERPDNLIPQLKVASRPQRDNFIKGSKHMLLGFFKKICVADVVAIYVNSVYNDPEGASGLSVLIATVLFAVQIYCDFSGYTDIATGAARIMGIRLMKNFDHPYTATSIKEFWGRWHISLSTWFRDYLYIPLGGNRRGRARQLLNVMIVFLVSGLWHGANWTFVLWGAIHGAYQIIGALTIKPRNYLLSKIKLSPTHSLVVWGRRIGTFILVDFAWLFFRANSISDAGILISKIFSPWGGFASTLSAMGFGEKPLDIAVSLLVLLVSIAILIILDRMLIHGEGEDGSEVLTKNGSFVFVVLAIALVWIFLLSRGVESSFIYFQF